MLKRTEEFPKVFGIILKSLFVFFLVLFLFIYFSFLFLFFAYIFLFFVVFLIVMLLLNCDNLSYLYIAVSI